LTNLLNKFKAHRRRGWRNWSKFWISRKLSRGILFCSFHWMSWKGHLQLLCYKSWLLVGSCWTSNFEKKIL